MAHGKDTTSEDGRRDPVTDLVDGVKAYALQETVGPVRGAGRWVAVGTLGALALGMAVVFFALAVLRMVQDLGGASLDGGWSFVPYLLTLIVLAAVTAVTFSRVSRPSLQRGE
ncbi:MAG: hypothetical protein RL330_1237 [Actinomycetota bacterium]|jgi:hypothetical protein